MVNLWFAETFMDVGERETIGGGGGKSPLPTVTLEAMQPPSEGPTEVNPVTSHRLIA